MDYDPHTENLFSYGTLKDVHSIIHFSGNPEDQIPGMVFKISLKELEQADQYEVADYKRVEVKLSSGMSAWVYVAIDNP